MVKIKPYFSGTCAAKNTPLRFGSAADAARDANERTARQSKTAVFD